MEEFIQAVEDALPGLLSTDISERWEHLRDTIYNTAVSPFGKREVKSGDWFETYSEDMLSLIEEKIHALSTYTILMRTPCLKTLQTLRTVRNKVQQTARCCANDYSRDIIPSS